jgi:protein tyrosine phosphatase
MFCLLALTAGFIMQSVYRYYFDNYVVAKGLQNADEVYKNNNFEYEIPEIIPRNFSFVSVSTRNNNKIVSFYYRNGEVWSYKKGESWLDYEKLTMNNNAYWVHRFPLVLANILFIVALVSHIGRTGRFIILSPRLDLHSPLENELILYSILLVCGYFIFS